jgi:hypothetical protein
MRGKGRGFIHGAITALPSSDCEKQRIQFSDLELKPGSSEYKAGVLTNSLQFSANANRSSSNIIGDILQIVRKNMRN